jgi:hypothetical protein
MKSPPRTAVVASLVLGVLGACVGSDATAPEAPASAKPVVLESGSNPALIQCPAPQATTSSAVIGMLGGVLNLGAASISIPAGALLQSSIVTVTVPASPYVEVDITIDGAEHFLFELPVVVTISYARCSPGAFLFTPLSAWHIDSETNALLENMGGIDNKLTRTVTFVTGHLSGYAVAN